MSSGTAIVNQRSESGVGGDTLYSKMNTTADTNSATVANFSGCEFVFGLSEEVSDITIKVMQDFFKAYPLGKQYNARLGQVNKEVIIMDEFAADTMQLPQVIVGAIPASNFPLHLGNRQGKETFNDHLFQVYSGQVNMELTIDLYDNSKPAVGRLADIVFLSFMYYVTMRLLKLYITVDHAKVRFSKATKITGDKVGGEIYNMKLTFPAISEWKQFMEIETVDSAGLVTEATKPNTDKR